MQGTPRETEFRPEHPHCHDSKDSKHAEARETGRWSSAEHERFMYGIMQYGKDWKKVEQLVGTRTGSQVRSHAQKFFNKIQKEQRDKSKKHKGEIQLPRSHEAEFSETENEFMRNNFYQDDATPIELVTLIRKESKTEGKVNLTNLKKSLEDQDQRVAQDEVAENPDLLQLKRYNSFRSMNNILSAYENVTDEGKPKVEEDEGFLLLLTKKYKKYFSNERDFESLIDFGNPQQVANANKIEKSIRKKSFTLLEGSAENEEFLEEIKKKIKAEGVEDRKVHSSTGPVELVPLHPTSLQTIINPFAHSEQKIKFEERKEGSAVIPIFPQKINLDQSLEKL